MPFLEFLKYKLDKAPGGGPMGPGGPGEDRAVSGMLWVHLLAGRGLRSAAVGSTASTPVTPSGGGPTIGK